MEIENLCKLVEKMQQETIEVEREKGTSSQMESYIRERLFIMEDQHTTMIFQLFEGTNFLKLSS